MFYIYKDLEVATRHETLETAVKSFADLTMTEEGDIYPKCELISAILSKTATGMVTQYTGTTYVSIASEEGRQHRVDVAKKVLGSWYVEGDDRLSWDYLVQ